MNKHSKEWIHLSKSLASVSKNRPYNGREYLPSYRTLDYIDLFLIHNPHSGTERRLATYKALQECKTAGKIHTVGVSN